MVEIVRKINLMICSGYSRHCWVNFDLSMNKLSAADDRQNIGMTNTVGAGKFKVRVVIIYLESITYLKLAQKSVCLYQSNGSFPHGVFVNDKELYVKRRVIEMASYFSVYYNSGKGDFMVSRPPKL